MSEEKRVGRSILRLTLQVAIAVASSYLGHAQTPVISSVSPNPMGIGQSVVISGTNFGSSGTVTFNGLTASTGPWSATSVTATVPAGATNGNIVVTSGGHSSVGFAYTLNNGPVNYVYDPLGRLVGVVDVNGNAAEYTYDAVGNILSISRFTSTQVSIIQVNPGTGPVGTQVTIYGTGFSSTANQNTVKFNGITATVATATNTQLQVSVPSSATSGPISVTCPNGSVTSSLSFTVTPSNGVPTITSFTPGSGVATNAVTVTGTNFDPTLANNKLRLNSSPAAVTATTSTTISTTVPTSTASGHFSVVTPLGNAISSQDFYIPFGSHVASDIGFTARIASGGTQTLSLAANKIALVLFDGLEGQRINLTVTNSSFATCNLFLIGPNNTNVTNMSCTVNTDLSPTLLNKTGTYTIGIDPGPSSGSITLSMAGDFVGAISIDGPAVTATTTLPYQDARLTFESLGQRIVVYATNVTNSGANLNLVTPSQTTQANIFISNSPSGQTFFMDTQALLPGTYQLWIPHNSLGGASETLQISSVPADFTGTLTLPTSAGTGAAVRVPTTGNLAVGQNGVLTFTASAGQKVSVNVQNPTIGTSYTSCTLKLYDPNHNSITNGYCGTGAPSYIDTVTLAGGTYTIVVDPQGTSTGSVSISLNNDPDVTTPAITVGGSGVTAKTVVAGQDVRLSFTPTASQPRIAIQATSVTNPLATLNLWTGTSTQASATIDNNPSGQTFFIDTQSVNANQQYQLWVQHSGANFGNETLKIFNVPADISRTVTVNGAATTFSTSAGQNANIKFSISTSESITVHWTSGTYPSTLNCYMRVTGPSPSTNQVGFANCNTATGTVSLGTLSSGTYNILVDPQAQSTGGMTLSVTTP